MAVVPQAGPRLAHRLVSAVPGEIIHDEQVQPAIVVYIQPGPANRPERTVLAVRLVQPRFPSDIREGPVAIVVIQAIAKHTADEQVFITVVVVVSDRDAIVEAGPRQSRFYRDVLEIPVAVSLEQAVRVLG